MASYNAVKAAVVALTETAGHELAEYGVRASVVCPSYFRTNLMASLRGADEVVGRGGHLVGTSPITADDIAADVLDGLDRGDELIIPDEPAREAYALKQADRAAYDAVMRAQAAKLTGGSDGLGSPTGGTTRTGTRPSRSATRTPSTSRRSRRGCASTPTPAVRRDDLAGTPEVRQFPGGASNLTYLLRYPARDLILRRPPTGAEGRERPRHGPRVPDPVRAAPVFPYVARWSGSARTSR